MKLNLSSIILSFPLSETQHIPVSTVCLRDPPSVFFLLCDVPTLALIPLCSNCKCEHLVCPSNY